MMKTTSFKIMCTILYACHVWSQRIDIKSFDQTLSVTSCRRGLRHDIDRVVMVADVDFPPQGDTWYRVVQFQIKPLGADDSSYTHLCGVDLREGCSGSVPDLCYCSSASGNVSYRAVINMTARAAYSGATVRGVMRLHNNSAFYQPGEKRLPAIFDLSSVKLQLNNESWTSGKKMEISSNQSIISFCCFNSPDPCTVKIKHGVSVLTSGVNCTELNLKTKLNRTTTLSLQIDVCGYLKSTGSYVYIYEYVETPKKEEEKFGTPFIISLSVASGLLLVFLSAAFIQLCVKMRHRARRLNQRKDLPAIYNSLDDLHIYHEVQNEGYRRVANENEAAGPQDMSTVDQHCDGYITPLDLLQRSTSSPESSENSLSGYTTID
ncbi:uncharacterized protein LOC131958142 [Physella acuta]|uniref:uncharacterized protein LOC131958142 n=1 Tax=Physella acuta TaxID=109671 RepID=UPI0027DC9DA7|nr:uncharacterized protein LOC131958142 [Physella acuta]